MWLLISKMAVMTPLFNIDLQPKLNNQKLNILSAILDGSHYQKQKIDVIIPSFCDMVMAGIQKTDPLWSKADQKLPLPKLEFKFSNCCVQSDQRRGGPNWTWVQSYVFFNESPK